MSAFSLHLFGASTPTGEAFRQLVGIDSVPWEIHTYSRRPHGKAGIVQQADFNKPESFQAAETPLQPALWISFAPIWRLTPFLEQLAQHHPERLQGLCGLIACSSSSVVTKRFATNRFDRELVAKLTDAEDRLVFTCNQLQVSCRILRPTLIYGQAGPYGDRNLSRLIRIMRRLPFLPLPAETGLRQPIHAVQLAAVTLRMAAHLAQSNWNPELQKCVTVGGDSELSYCAMLKALQQVLPTDDSARRCRLVSIPSPLFQLMAAPLLLRSPKAFEAVLRMGADLSGFTPVHQLLGAPTQPFPVLPLAS
jgi:hypothetical protein